MSANVTIEDLAATDQDAVEQAAMLLVEAFRGHSAAWPDFVSAYEEVQESFGDDRISRIARDEDGRVAGWIGGIPGYDGNVWEVHPLAVRPDLHRRRVGTALLNDLERLATKRGALTLWVGADDEDGRTSLGGEDLFPDLLDRLAAIENRDDHPFSFYLRRGFCLAGVLPDANGFGKPDIFLAKRLASR
jgi:aminoglycoside 6'-N-acetyltransferase I